MASNTIYETSNDDYTIEEALFENVMEGKWDEVLEIYKRDFRAYRAKITSSGHTTALHLAVSDAKEEIVEKLINQIVRTHNLEEAKQVLRFGNEKGQTPLHVAAAMGNLRICRCIAAIDSSLVVVRDRKGETPVYRAVHFGQIQTFFGLHTILLESNHYRDQDYSFCWRDDGYTILHCAIAREKFDLAFQIIHLFKGLLVDRVDKRGLSPLHVLAKKYSAFKSGSNLRGCDKVLYNCLQVKELKEEELEKHWHPQKGIKDEVNPRDSENHSTTILSSIGLLLRNAVGIGHTKKEGTNVDVENCEGHLVRTDREQFRSILQANCIRSCLKYFVELVSNSILFVFGYGHTTIRKIREEKERHVWAVLVLNGLLEYSTTYGNPELSTRGASHMPKSHKKDTKSLIGESLSTTEDSSEEEYEDNDDESTRGKKARKEEIPENDNSIKETAILIAAKHGIVEMVEKILERFRVAIYDKDQYSRNVLLIAVENRHLEIFKFLLKKHANNPVVLQKTDKNGDIALHYAAKYNEDKTKPWPVPGAALQMQWEIKWYEFVENSMPPRFFLRTNKECKTPQEIFTSTHKGLVKAGGEWLTSTATSCSVVATLIATVAFASSTTVPGDSNNSSGKPVSPINDLTFELFAISSLVALCFSVTSLITFLAILTSRHQEKDFGKKLPRKILLGLTSLFVSIGSMLVAFCAGHFLIFENKFKYATLPVYVVILLPVCLFAAAQFSLYFDIFRAAFWSPFR